MNKPAFDPNQPYQAAEKPPFDPNQSFEPADNQESGFQMTMDRIMPQINQSPAGLLNQGYQMVQKGAEKVGNMLKERLPKEGIRPLFARESIPVSQPAANAIGTFTKYSPDIISMASTPLEATKPQVLNKVGRAGAKMVQSATGIPEEATASLFNKPTSLFKAPFESTVSKAYKASEFGDVAANLENSLDNIIQKAKSTPRALVSRGATALKQYVDEGVQNAKALFEGRHGLDREIAALKSQINTAGAKNVSTSALQDIMNEKLALRQTFNNALDKLAPKLREADALAAERFKISPFRKFFLPGEINFISPKGIMRAAPGLPYATGLGVSAAGAVNKGIETAASQLPKAIVPVTSRILKKRRM